jgi:hypothetical protein
MKLGLHYIQKMKLNQTSIEESISFHMKIEFCYGVSGLIGRYLKFFLISIINFYYVINKLIIMVSDQH